MPCTLVSSSTFPFPSHLPSASEESSQADVPCRLRVLSLAVSQDLSRSLRQLEVMAAGADWTATTPGACLVARHGATWQHIETQPSHRSDN